MTTPSPPPPSNGHEGGSKPTTTTDDSSSTIRLTLQVDNTSALPIFLQGRTVAIRGGQLDRYTLDAKEPIQRQQIHSQLEQARRLRASLEDAASKVEALSSSSSSSSTTSKKSLHAQAMNILQSSLPQIHQLEKLTNALEEGGGYTTTNLHGNESEKTRKQQRRELDMEKEREREQQIIRKHLREFVRESNPMAKIDHEEMEEDVDSLVDGMNIKLEGTGMMMMKGTTRSFNEEILNVSPSSSGRAAALPTTTTTATVNNKPSKRKSSSHSLEDQTRKKSKPDLKRSKSNDSSSRRDDGRRSKVVQDGKKNKRSDKQQFASSKKDPPQDVPPSSSSMSRPPSSMSNVSIKDNRTTTSTKKSSPPATAAAAAKKMPKPRATKKCHECRKSSNRHRVCNFWKLSGFTGAKCGKVFCIDCLTSKYSVGDDVRGDPSTPNGNDIEEIMRNSNLDSEWHCPSCLGVCQCHVCVAQRKREEEREKNRGDGERKSQRRATAHSSYYNFF